MLGFVYLWTNVINGKRYIGSHVGTIDDGYMGSGILFRQAIKKYGKENFVRTVLYEEFNNIETLRLKELEIINNFNASDSDMYYNLRTHAAMERAGPKHSEETRALISESRKLYYQNPENKKTQSETMKKKWKEDEYRRRRNAAVTNDEYVERMRLKNSGENNPMYGKIMSAEQRKERSIRNSGSGNPFYGKTHTEETRKKIKDNKTPLLGKDNPSSVMIEVYGKVYETIKMAMSKTGLSYNKINKIGKRLN